MKIEMGESLFYSWLRHVKQCQIVQTNWTTSNSWDWHDNDDNDKEAQLQRLMQTVDAHFASAHGYRIFKQTSSLSQFLKQAECDAIGISKSKNGETKYYGVDVAFHESGLNYGKPDLTIMKILSKSIRTAMCIYAYLDSKEAEIIFASPKINRNVLSVVQPCIQEMQQLTDQMGYHFLFRIIGNDDFYDQVLHPILIASKSVADTNELFLRSYQMVQMFEKQNRKQSSAPKLEPVISQRTYAELRIGTLAQTVLRDMLTKGSISKDELAAMQTKDYSKQVFNLYYPLLVRTDVNYDSRRYYKEPIRIKGVEYRLCSQWFDTNDNRSNRPYLLKWIEEHGDKTTAQ